MKRLKTGAVNSISFIRNISYTTNSFDVQFEKVVGGTILSLSNLQDVNNLDSCKDFIVLNIDLVTNFVEGGEYYMTITNTGAGGSATYLCEIEESYFNNSASTGIYADSVRLVDATTDVVKNQNSSSVYVATNDGNAPDFALSFLSGIHEDDSVILNNDHLISLKLQGVGARGVSQVKISVITGTLEFSRTFNYVNGGSYTISDLTQQNIGFGMRGNLRVDLLNSNGDSLKHKTLDVGIPPLNPSITFNSGAVFFSTDWMSFITRIKLYAEDTYFDENDVVVQGPQTTFINTTNLNSSDPMPLTKVLTANQGEVGILDTHSRCERRYFVTYVYSSGLISPSDDYENYSAQAGSLLTKTF